VVQVLEVNQGQVKNLVLKKILNLNKNLALKINQKKVTKKIKKASKKERIKTQQNHNLNLIPF
jgi:hypothetical protein